MAVRKKKDAVDRNPTGEICYNAFFTIGCDPELFLVDDKGNVVGSEKVIPKKGLSDGYGGDKVVRDGVQIELHPSQTTCRANVGNSIQRALQELDATLSLPGNKNYRASFADVVEVSRKELETLSPESRVLGCMPSLNLYKPSTIRVNPATYRKRSGGGHIHMSDIPKGILTNPKSVRNLILMFDTFVGNTCVLIDRSPNSAKRRRVYGRAGEYRLPKWGVEYRTLSNFWMHSYQLFSLVAALMRMGASASYTTYQRSHGSRFYAIKYADVEGIVLDSVNVPRIQRAINRNDLDMAMRNWEDLKPVIRTYYTMPMAEYEGINRETIEPFEFFAKKIQEKAASGTSKYNGLDAWWDHDPMQHWCGMPEGHGTGWESFMTRRILPAYRREQAKNADPAQAAA